jgi:hypothetical protein
MTIVKQGKNVSALIVILILFGCFKNHHAIISSTMKASEHIIANDDSIRFHNFISDLILFCDKGKLVSINKCIEESVCINNPNILIGRQDSVSIYISGEYSSLEASKFLILGMNEFRKKNLTNPLNWTFYKDKIQIYDRFDCGDCPDSMFSYYWCFIRHNGNFKLSKIFNNDFESICQ